MKSLCASLAFLTLIATATPLRAAPPCAANPQYKAVDFSMPVHELVVDGHRPALDVLKRFGVRTIIRYYDWADETFACKTLLKDESDAILKHGLSIATVFQHKNEDPEIFFLESRGARDARRALELADANGQPYNTAIYFAVDGVDDTIDAMVAEYRISDGKPPSRSRLRKLARVYGHGLKRYLHHYERFLDYRPRRFKMSVSQINGRLMLPYVATYFRTVAATFKAAGRGTYQIGAYGSGQTCDFLLSKKLVAYCWVSQSTSWPGTKAFVSTKRWSLLQKLPTTCPAWSSLRDRGTRVQFDFNIVGAARANFGQWSSKRSNTTPLARPALCPALDVDR